MPYNFTERFLRHNAKVITLSHELGVQFDDEMLDGQTCEFDTVKKCRHIQQTLIKRTYRKLDKVMSNVFCPECDVSIEEKKEEMRRQREEFIKSVREKKTQGQETLRSLKARKGSESNDR